MSGTCASTLFAAVRSACLPCSASSVASRTPKKSSTIEIPWLGLRWLYLQWARACAGDATRLDILKQVAIIGCHFHYVASRSQGESRDHVGDVALGV